MILGGLIIAAGATGGVLFTAGTFAGDEADTPTEALAATPSASAIKSSTGEPTVLRITPAPALASSTATAVSTVTPSVVEAGPVELRPPATTTAPAPAVGIMERSDKGLPEPGIAEEAFGDIFESATRVDRVSIEDIENCRVASQYDVGIGDIVSVEIAFARKEGSPYVNWDFYYFRIIDSSDDGVLGNEVNERSIHGNPVPIMSYTPDQTDSDLNGVMLYRLRLSGWTAWPEDGDIAIGEWVEKYHGSLAPGIYVVRGLENADRPSDCDRMLERTDITNLIPDSLVIAWYVD